MYDGKRPPQPANDGSILTHRDYTIGWICALSKEQTAAIAMLDEKHPLLSTPSTNHNVYTLGSIAGHNIVITCLPMGDYGLVPASKTATRMAGTFPNIRVGLMVGIGEGIPSAKVQLGDVVVSIPTGTFPGVVLYDMGKQNPSGYARSKSLNKPPTVFLTAVQALRSNHDLHGNSIAACLCEVEQKYPNLAKSGYTTCSSLDDPIFGPNTQPTPGWHTFLVTILALFLSVFKYFAGLGWQPPGPSQIRSEEVAPLGASKRLTREVMIHYGLIASGNTVIKNAKYRDRLNKDLGGHVLCFEMEAAGLMDDFPCLVIRGICDYSDSNKNKQWQKYAAMIAAAYTKDRLRFVQHSHVDSIKPVSELLKSELQ